MAARGYPGTPDRGHPITGIENVTGAQVFHAGTSLENGRLVTAGGRVLGVTALGTNLRTSLDAAYDAVGKIGFEGMQFRKDIGAKGLRRGGI
jgi:phosphoribosylamine--glycine ligase